MTLQEFLARLRETAQTWKFEIFAGSGIRTERKGMCPLSAVVNQVAGKYINNRCYRAAGIYLHLTEADAYRIARAADFSELTPNKDPNFQKQARDHRTLRKELLDACGLLDTAKEHLGA